MLPVVGLQLAMDRGSPSFVPTLLATLFFPLQKCALTSASLLCFDDENVRRLQQPTGTLFSPQLDVVLQFLTDPVEDFLECVLHDDTRGCHGPAVMCGLSWSVTARTPTREDSLRRGWTRGH